MPEAERRLVDSAIGLVGVGGRRSTRRACDQLLRRTRHIRAPGCAGMIQGNIRGRDRRLDAHRSFLSDGALALIPRLVNHPNTKSETCRRPSIESEWLRSANGFWVSIAVGDRRFKLP